MTEAVEEDWPTPAFRVPFDEEQLVLMGLVAVVWGQIDFYVNQIIQTLHGIDHQQRRLLLKDSTIGPKLDLLLKSIDRAADDRAKEAIRRAVEVTKRTVERRNACAHGIWGLWTGGDGPPVAAVMTKPGIVPVVKADDLRQLYADIADASALVDEAFCLVSGFAEHARGRTLYFGPQPPGA